MVASAAGATASAVGLILAVMVFGYYMLVDFGTLDDSLIQMVPGPYRADVRRLLDETGAVWQAFLRGQLILGLVVGSVVAVVMTALGVRFSLVLGLIAGALEFVPIFGPLIAGLIAVLVALFQGANWWGPLSPLVRSGGPGHVCLDPAGGEQRPRAEDYRQQPQPESALCPAWRAGRRSPGGRPGPAAGGANPGHAASVDRLYLPQSRWPGDLAGPGLEASTAVQPASDVEPPREALAEGETASSEA